MTTTWKFVLPTPDNLDELYTKEEQKKIYEALKAKFLGQAPPPPRHPYDNTPHTYCEECDCCIACDCCVCDGEGGQLHDEKEDEEKCSNCDAHLDEDEHIFIFTKGDEDVTMCRVCGDDTHEQMKADGWTRDDDSAGGANDNDFTDCEDCGYTHLCEDKCPNEATACHYEKWREEGESDDSWEPDCCKCGTTTDSKGMGGVELREDLCGWYCGRCYEHHKTPEPKEHQPTFIITVRRKKTSNQ